MISPEELYRRLDEVMDKEAELFLTTVPYARHLTDVSEPLNERYYIRHRIETVKRIRMTSKTDALALAKMVQEDYESARHWSHYTAQELSHDILYLQDLRKHGCSPADVDAVDVFHSTEQMVRYLEN